VDAGGVTGPGAGLSPPARRCCPRSPAWTEVTGIGGPAAQVLIAEVGLNMSVHTHLTSRRSDLVQYLKSR
jgi:hypothetical protein